MNVISRIPPEYADSAALAGTAAGCPRDGGSAGFETNDMEAVIDLAPVALSLIAAGS